MVALVAVTGARAAKPGVSRKGSWTRPILVARGTVRYAQWSVQARQISTAGAPSALTAPFPLGEINQYRQFIDAAVGGGREAVVADTNRGLEIVLSKLA